MILNYVQGSAKVLSLGCIKHAPVAKRRQDTGITQPGNHSLANPCRHCHLTKNTKTRTLQCKCTKSFYEFMTLPLKVMNGMTKVFNSNCRKEIMPKTITLLLPT